MVLTHNSKAVEKILRSGENRKSQIENPSATAEEKIIKASDAEPKSVRRKKPNGSKVRGFFFLQSKNCPQLWKTKAKTHPQLRKTKTTHLPIPASFQMRLRAAIGPDHIVDDLRNQRKKSKQWVAQSKHQQRLSESS